MDDPGSIIASVIFYLLLILGCGYFAGTEISLASVNRIHIMSYADNGDHRAERVLKILDNFDEALSVLLIGNNVMNIGCATLSVVIANKIWHSVSGGISTSVTTVATVITTVLLFIFGEMIPKCFARSCNEKFAMSVSGSLIFLMRLLRPLSAFFTFISKVLTAPFTKNIKPEVTMTEDELQDIVDNISEDDGFDEDKGKLVKSAMKFNDLTVGEIMLPWDNVLKIKSGTKNEEVFEIIKNSVYSRIPVVGRDGSIRGILHIRKFLRAYMENKRVVLASAMVFPYYVKSDVKIDDLLAGMSNRRRNFAVVRDDNDIILGIVTVEDILEQLVGEIYDENDIGGKCDE